MTPENYEKAHNIQNKIQDFSFTLTQLKNLTSSENFKLDMIGFSSRDMNNDDNNKSCIIDNLHEDENFRLFIKEKYNETINYLENQIKNLKQEFAKL